MKHLLTMPDAVAHIRGGTLAPHLAGVIEFYRKRGAVLVIARITGLPSSNASGFFALHIHDGSSCAGTDFSAAGGHFNPASRPHPMHAGDLPPLLSCAGRAYLAVLTDRFQVEEILGRTAVIHSNADDFHSQPAGNAGTKIGCGKILPAAR